MSDLHLERIEYDYDVIKAASYLILGGDIGRFSDREQYTGFIRKQCSLFEHVLLVPGNHEFYGCTRLEGLAIARELEQDPSLQGKLVVLNRARFDMPGALVSVLGCTLHSHISPRCTRKTNDFRRIKDWSIDDHNQEHLTDLVWLKAAVEQIAQERLTRQVVVVTHYAPSFEQTCHPMHHRNEASECFCSETLQTLSEWPGAANIKLWIFGHTHWNAKFKQNNITITSNQLCSDARDLSWWQRRTMLRPFNPEALIVV